MKAKTPFRTFNDRPIPKPSESIHRHHEYTAKNFFATTCIHAGEESKLIEPKIFRDHYRDSKISMWADNIINIEKNRSKLVILGMPIGFDFLLIYRDFDLARERMKDCQGIFAFIIYDTQDHRISIITDHLGIQPIYLKDNGNGCVISTKASLIRSEISISNLGSLFILGFTLGKSTLGDGIERAEAGSITDILVEKNQISSTTHWTIRDCSSKDKKNILDDLVDLFRLNTQQYSSLASSGTLFLSGGYDSRLLLSFLLDQRLSVGTSIVSHSDEAFDLDRRLAHDVARFSSLAYQICYPNEDYYSSRYFEEYYLLTEGETLCFDLFICKLHPFVNQELMYDGLAPNHSLRHIAGLENNFDDFVRNLVEPATILFRQAASLVLKRSIIDRMIEEFRKALELHTAEFENTSTGVWQFLVSSRMRNRTSVNAAKVFPSRALVAPIGMDRQIWEVAGALTLSDRKTSRYVRLMLEKLQPRLLTIPVISGGQLRTDGATIQKAFHAQLLNRAGQSWRLKKLLEKVSLSPPYDAYSGLDLERLIANGDCDWLRRDVPPSHWRQDAKWRYAAKVVFHLEGWHWIRSSRLSEEFRSAFSRNRCV